MAKGKKRNKHQNKLKQNRRKERLERTDRYAAAEIAVDSLVVIPAYVLHDMFGFGNKRLEKFIDEYKRLWSLVKDDKVKVDTLRASLDAETGIVYNPSDGIVYNRKG